MMVVYVVFVVVRPISSRKLVIQREYHLLYIPESQNMLTEIALLLVEEAKRYRGPVKSRVASVRTALAKNAGII